MVDGTRRYAGYRVDRFRVVNHVGRQTYTLDQLLADVLSDLPRGISLRPTTLVESAGTLGQVETLSLSIRELVGLIAIATLVTESEQLIVGRLPSGHRSIVELVLTDRTDPGLGYLSPSRVGPRRKCMSIGVTTDEARALFGDNLRKVVKIRTLSLPPDRRGWVERGMVFYIDVPVTTGVVVAGREEASVWRHFVLVPVGDGVIPAGLQY